MSEAFYLKGLGMSKPAVPIGKTPPEAIALREAAIAFGMHANVESKDQHDKHGVKLNRVLLKAAIDYAAVAVISREDVDAMCSCCGHR